MLYKHLFKFPLKLLIIGRSESGKSYLLRKRIIPKIIDEYENIFVISPTVHLDTGWNRLKNKNKKNKEKIIFINEYDDNALKELLNEFGANKMEANNSDIPEEDQPKFLIILDDVTDQLSQSKRDFFSQLAIFGRHYNLSYIITSHKYNIINRLIRNNAKIKLFFRIDNTAELNTILDDSESYYVKKPELDEMLDLNTGNFNSFLIKEGIDNKQFYNINPSGQIKKLTPDYLKK